jgi:trehalose-phosphatase
MKSGHTRLIVISGRVIDDLKQLLTFDRYPEMWGVHGAQQYLPDENITRLVIPRRVADELIEAEKWAKKEQLTSFIEKKPAGLAFNWQGRTDEEKEKVLNAMRKFKEQKPLKTSLVIHDIDDGVEMKSVEISKANAVKSILADLPIDSAIAYLGDNDTDEDAFQALAGRGLRVLVRAKTRATAADVRIDPPGELLEFLDRWTHAL